MNELIIVVVILAFAWFIYIEPAVYAARRGSSGIGWFIVGCFLPLISWALVLILYSHKPIVRN